MGISGNSLVDIYINMAEDERTVTTKATTRTKERLTKQGAKKTILQKGWDMGHAVTLAARRMPIQIQQRSTNRVWFNIKSNTQYCQDYEEPIMITYDSRADENYTSEADRKNLRLSILWDLRGALG